VYRIGHAAGNVARVRAFCEWLASGREDAIRAAAEILERPGGSTTT